MLPVNRCIADSPPDPWSLCLDIGAGNGLCLTTPHAGLRIAPLGMGGHRRSLGNIFTDKQDCAHAGPGWPIIANASGQLLCWLCGLVVAEGVQAQPGAQALLLRWVHNPGLICYRPICYRPIYYRERWERDEPRKYQAACPLGHCQGVYVAVYPHAAEGTVAGIITTPAGVRAFTYDPAARLITLDGIPAAQSAALSATAIAINEYGWEEKMHEPPKPRRRCKPAPERQPIRSP